MTQTISSLLNLVAWVLARSSTILGALLWILIPSVYLYWRSSIKQAVKKQLEVRVERCPDAAKTTDWYKHAPLLGYLEIDQEIAAADCPGLKLMSLGEYMASLKPRGAISLQRGLISIMDKYGLRIALPLALFAPPSWKKENNMMGAFTNSPYAGLLISNMLSTLGLMSVSIVAHRQNIDARRYAAKMAAINNPATVVAAAAKAAAADVAEKLPDKPELQTVKAKLKKCSALEIMVLGSNPANDDGLSSRMTSPFTLPYDMPTAAGLKTTTAFKADPNAARDSAPEPSLINSLFPDLASGNGGLLKECSQDQIKMNKVLSSLFNKLAGNSLAGVPVSKVVPKEEFIVRIPKQKINSSTSSDGVGDGITNNARDSDAATVVNDNNVIEYIEANSVEDFVDALEQTGHTVKMQMRSNMTSFGAGLCVKEGDENKTEWTQIPLAYPLSTGLYARDEAGNDVDVMTLMQHAAILVQINGPLITGNVEWCLSIEGMTGWIPAGSVYRAWAVGPHAVSYHATEALADSTGRRTALRLSTTSAAVLNVAGAEGHLLFGGYGALGVCIDSVAAVQQVLTGTCTLYPLILGGEAKIGLLTCYKWVQKKAAAGGTDGKWKYDEEARKLRDALNALPCDGIVEPGVAAATARRALACLPQRSVFAAVKRCRESLEAAIKAAESVMGPN